MSNTIPPIPPQSAITLRALSLSAVQEGNVHPDVRSPAVVGGGTGLEVGVGVGIGVGVEVEIGFSLHRPR